MFDALKSFFKPKKTKQAIEIEYIHELGNTLLNIIKNMTPYEVSERNLEYNFGDRPSIVQHGLKCVNKVHGNQTLTTAFANNIIFSDDDVDKFENCPPWNPAWVHTIKYPEDVIISAMDFMTELAVKYTPFWVKWNVDMPKGTLETKESLAKYIQSFDITKCKSVEQLRLLGRK
jgi:hypothetical protein